MRLVYPPPGQTMMATPVFFAFSGRKMVSVGWVTFVTFILVHCSSFAGPRSPGALAGQTFIFAGSSARSGKAKNPTEQTNADARPRSLVIIVSFRQKNLEMRQQ